MDVVAYSTLHMDRQQQLLHNLQEAVRTTPTFARAQAEEQLIRLPTGDGMALVFFHDPEAPVRCAMELAKILRDSPDIKLRMGVHTGPVYRVADINANRNVAGGGINTAQRVMDCGDVWPAAWRLGLRSHRSRQCDFRWNFQLAPRRQYT
jgi:class 3 adenylate cyclase